MPRGCIGLRASHTRDGRIAPGSGSSEAAQMKAVLEKEFRVPVRWTEEPSPIPVKMPTRALPF